jgi:hypothetical protein
VKIRAEGETFIHTRFATDGERLSAENARGIERGMREFLRERGIVFGVHLERGERDAGIVIVLECRPLADDAKAIRERLAEILEPIPRRPPATRVRVSDEAGAPTRPLSSA